METKLAMPRRQGAAHPSACQPASPARARLIEPGCILGSYVVVAPAHESRSARLYLAHDAALDRPVALKLSPVEKDYPRVRAEARTLARLHHPHIVRIYNLLETAAGPVLVLEWLAGQTLARRIAEQGALAPAEALDLLAQALAGLEHLHRLGLVHGNLTLDNLYVTPAGACKLLDFTLAGPASPARRLHDQVVLDPRSDLHTLGLGFYQAVTGGPGYDRHGLGADSENLSALPPAFADLLLKAIRKDPARRFQTAAEFREALQEYVSRAGHAARRPETAVAHRPAALLRAARLDLALIIACLGLILYLAPFDTNRSGESAQASQVQQQPRQERKAPGSLAARVAELAVKDADAYDDVRRAWSQ